jgi:hypothetical protein
MRIIKCLVCGSEFGTPTGNVDLGDEGELCFVMDIVMRHFMEKHLEEWDELRHREW